MSVNGQYYPGYTPVTPVIYGQQQPTQYTGPVVYAQAQQPYQQPYMPYQQYVQPPPAVPGGVFQHPRIPTNPDSVVKMLHNEDGYEAPPTVGKLSEIEDFNPYGELNKEVVVHYQNPDGSTGTMKTPVGNLSTNPSTREAMAQQQLPHTPFAPVQGTQPPGFPPGYQQQPYAPQQMPPQMQPQQQMPYQQPQYQQPQYQQPQQQPQPMGYPAPPQTVPASPTLQAYMPAGQPIPQLPAPVVQQQQPKQAEVQREPDVLIAYEFGGLPPFPYPCCRHWEQPGFLVLAFRPEANAPDLPRGTPLTIHVPGQLYVAKALGMNYPDVPTADGGTCTHCIFLVENENPV